MNLKQSTNTITKATSA
jgi:hypothetical protein